ncbi:phosphopeptide-binding protein [Streptomyces hygroscopicus]|uniref:FHA domain-containing protein n=1 Tax=Streptomyces hygroscopicus TaxID=1912 RepID=UPI00223F29A3|nr:FHA domain-containing protein [Streptomyces hygroscopicus]MCW7945253.1 phosphopeptide-binding protein [Streptomyces hygroscopicus]
MPTCPNGHQSGSDDWCEVCGHRMAGAVPPPPPPPPPTAGYGYPPPGPPPPPPVAGGRPPSAVPDPEPELCPQCRTPREGGAPFCEECRWNFLTNTATSYTPAAPPPSAPNPALRFQQGGQTMPGPDSYDYQSSRPSRVNRPAEPIPPGPPFGSEPSGPTGFGQDPSRPSGFGDEPSRSSGFGADSSRPSAFGADSSPSSAFGADPSRTSGSGGDPSRPSGFGADPSRPSGFGADPSRPSGFGADPSRPSGFGADPSRPVPPPPGPTPGGPGASGGPGGPGASGGPGTGAQGAPSYQQGAPPAAFQRPGPPPPPPAQGFPPPSAPQSSGPSFGDDWVIPPPSSGAPTGPGGPGAVGGPGGGQGGGYGYPPPGPTQAPPHPYEQQPVTWTATIGPDREYFMAMMQRSGPEAAGLNLPAYSPEQQRTLNGNQVTIGRRRHSTGDTPDIDLSVPPEDPGVSHQHAVLVQQQDGSWAVVDQNSTNGTTVNGGEEPIQPFVPVPLQDGDRVHVGAWTTITVRRG